VKAAQQQTTTQNARKHAENSKTIPTRPQALPQRALRGTTNEKTHTEIGSQAAKQASKKVPRSPAGLQTVSFVVINSQKILIKIKTAQIKRFFRF
jgi:hypothetical protein